MHEKKNSIENINIAYNRLGQRRRRIKRRRKKKRRKRRKKRRRRRRWRRRSYNSLEIIQSEEKIEMKEKADKI
jgi:hypothetical protein